MKNTSIITFGKFIFWLFFAFGNIALLGDLITQNKDFAIFGFMLLIYGSIINSVIVFFLLIFAYLNDDRKKDCFTTIGFILLNIPIAFLYAIIGLFIIN